MTKVLIVYFTRTETSRIVADILHDELVKGGTTIDVEEIKSAQVKLGWWNYLVDCWKIFTGGKYILDLPPAHKPADYDAVLIGTPVWGYGLCGPVKEWLTETTFEAESKTIFGSFTQCVYSGFDRAHGQIEALVKKPLAAKQTVFQKETKGDGAAAKQKAAEFAQSILKALGKGVKVTPVEDGNKQK
ncbi:MAG: hypothetical protein EZS28_008771 [Streblomastix strix]|uniref:Flavodoxin-like domain-containing protein n=1 Tax=Streblomastix strix TaxID=222440 RepID=A0A5J4WL89_9EUKA|nr:MAG: hypothetical protein EZS28_008771 [Streblomastix strix]